MIEFYNVKKKERVQIPENSVSKAAIKKTTKSGGTVIRYSLKAVDSDGTKLSKFCSKAFYDSFKG